MNGNKFAPGTLLILKDIAEDVEDSHGHVVLESLEDDTYVLGHPTEICAHLPLGVFVYDAEFGTMNLCEDSPLEVDDDTPDGEVEELDSDSADEGVYEIISSVEDYDDETMRIYGAYQEIVEHAAGFETTPEEVDEVRETYPEVIDLLQNLILDPLGLLDPVALLNGAFCVINERIKNGRKQEIAIGIFMDLYADEFGPQMFELSSEEDEIEAPHMSVDVSSNVWLSKKMMIDALETALHNLKSNEDISESDVGPGYHFIVTMADEYIQGLRTEVDPEEDAVETVEDLPG